MNYLPKDNTLDFVLWCKMYLPEESNSTPLYQYKMVDFLFNVDSHIKNIRSFRGSAKSVTVCKMALYRIVSGLNRYVLIISDTALQGEALISDIVNFIQFGNIPGIKLVRAIAGEVEIDVGGNLCYILSKGSGASMRGVKRGSFRADLCITDDLMNDQIAMNRLRMNRLESWYFKVLRPSLNPDSEIWNVGTPLNAGDIFMKMCKLHPTFDNPLTVDSWIDRFTPEWIERTKQEYKDAGQLRAWKQEFELVLADEDSRLFDMNKVVYVDSMPKGVTCHMTCDLAFSEKNSADYSAIIVNGIDVDGNWYVYPVRGRWKPSKTASVIMELKDQFNVLEVGIESGSSYIAVKEHLDTAMMEYQSWFTISELKHGGNSKFSRVASLEPVVNAGRLHIVDNGEDAEALIDEMELVDNVSINSGHDDLIDAMAYQVQMNLYYNDNEEPTREDYSGFTSEYVSNYI
jgi:phage terminase large subunit-like protein